jgi:2-methylcitrate dehydratase PrpD
MGNNVKEGIPWATAMALTAVDAAAEGFTGPIDLLDHEARYTRAVLLDGLGAHWHIENAYFKPYGCCRWAHGAIDGILAIQVEHGIAADEIIAVQIATFARALTLNNDAAPKTIESAQYSVPFCVALAAVRGARALVPVKEEALRDPEVLAFAPLVRLSVDPALDAMFSRSVPARVEVMTRNGRFVRTIHEPKGEPHNPMTWPDLLSKFAMVADTRLNPDPAEALVDGIKALHQGNIGPLKAALAASTKSVSAPRPMTAHAGELTEAPP